MTKPPASPEPPRVLVADDQADVLTALRLLCKGEGLAVDTANSPSALLTAVEKNDYAVVLMDLNYTRDTTSGREGLDVLEKLQRFDPTLPVIVMTAWGTINLAVEAVQRGAKDFIQKPWENPRLIQILRTQIELHSVLRRAGRLEAENKMLRGAETIPDEETLVAQALRNRPDIIAEEQRVLAAKQGLSAIKLALVHLWHSMHFMVASNHVRAAPSSFPSLAFLERRLVIF